MTEQSMTRAQVVDLLCHIKNEIDSYVHVAEDTKYDDGFNDGFDHAAFCAGITIDTAIKSVESGEYVQDS